MPGQLFLAHNVNMFAKQGMDRSPRTLTFRQVRALCTQREPTERVIIVIVTGRGKEKERLPVCRFKTPPCVPAKRPYVEMHVRVAGTHNEVLNLHTGTL